MDVGRGADRAVPPLRWFRLLVTQLVLLVLATTAWASLRLATGQAPRDAIEAGLGHALPLIVLSTGFALYRRRERYRANPHHLARDERREAADATTPRHPVPTDPRIRDEALRLARAVEQENAAGGRAAFVVLVVAALGFGIAGTVGSSWYLLSAAVLLLGLLLVPAERGRRARLAELERVVRSPQDPRSAPWAQPEEGPRRRTEP